MDTLQDKHRNGSSLSTQVSKLKQCQKRDVDEISLDDVTSLLLPCLEAQLLPGYEAAVAGSVSHFQTQKHDRGWGCGWRNLQMMASFLLHRDRASAHALFGGCGFVPNLLALQEWLECAWKAGIDTAGGDLLGNMAQGSEQWIGTTECAALLRLFGFKAEVVDFTGGLKNPNIDVDQHNNDVHLGVACNLCQQYPIVGTRFNSQLFNDCDLCERCHKLPESKRLSPFRIVQRASVAHNKAGGVRDSQLADKNQENLPPHERLMHWCWDHFTQGSHMRRSSEFDTFQQTSAAPYAYTGPRHKELGPSVAERALMAQRLLSTSPEKLAMAFHRPSVLQSGYSPLYFQHNGHSRTIVGVERFKAPGTQGSVYNLLVLDPAVSSLEIEARLKGGNGWQKLMKQGGEGLSGAQYQLLYVQPGLMQPKDKGKWDIMTAVETY